MNQFILAAVEKVTGQLIFLFLTEGAEHTPSYRCSHAVGQQHANRIAGIPQMLRELGKKVVYEHVIVQFFQFDFQFNQPDSPPKQKRQESTSVHVLPAADPAAYLP